MPLDIPKSVEMDNTILNSISKRLRISLLLNGVLLFAVAVLYLLFFIGKGTKDDSSSALSNKGGSLNNIAFVNSDTLIDNYDMVKSLKGDLEKKKVILEAEVSSRQQAFETKVKNYQNNLQKNLISTEQAKNAESKLMQERQDIMELSEKYTRLLSQQELEMNIRVQDSIINLVHRFNANNKFDFILGYSKGGGILFANEKHNITKDILKQLNEEYKKK